MKNQLYNSANAIINLFLFVVNLAARAQAAPADYDTTFGTSGKVTTQVGNTNTFIQDAALQPGGKIVAVGGGQLAGSNGSDFAVVRYLPGGQLDTSFAIYGKAFTDLGSASDNASAVLIQPDGKILVAGGTLINSRLDFALVRYHPNGTLDANFGSGGKVITSIDNWSDLAQSMALMSDGRIIVAGYSEDGSFDERFAAIRLLPSGAIDTSFGTDGKITVYVGANSDGATDALLQADGKIVLVGSGATGNTGTDFIVIRLNANSSLDSDFGASGKAIVNLSITDLARSAVLQPDGKILVAGVADDANASRKFAVVRLDADGSLDNGFAVFGKTTFQIGSGYEDEARAVAVQPNNKIVVAGTVKTNFENNDLAIARLTPSGALDASFGTSGKVILPSPGSDD
jgi:uncharacterized delta-60 repeat protein